MSQKYEPIETEYGTLYGRDCIFLDDVSFLGGTSSLKLTGEINKNLVSDTPRSAPHFMPYELTFWGVLALKMIEFDSWDYESVSSFDEVVHSKWIEKLGGKITNKHKHIFVQTYDDVFDVVCSSYKFKFLTKEE